MPPDVAGTAARFRKLALFLAPAWREAVLRLGLAWAALLVLFAGDWAAMADQWWNVSTYNHILLIPAIVGWLVWERAPFLARLVPQAWWPGMLPLVGGAFLWMLGAFAGLDTASQLGAVLMVIGTVPALMGPRVAAGLVFPLGYMLFLVPFGDELVPPLQMITAAITIWLVHLSGIPAAIDGVFINTPAGLFEVAEACSGVKFLIAMAAFGVLVAHLCFVSIWRRALFLFVCLVVPILANGIRAWATVYVAQMVGAEAASGWDHIVYGWIFFAIVIGLVLLLSWRFFDRSAAAPALDIKRIEKSPFLAGQSRKTMSAWFALAMVLLLALGVRGWAVAANRLSAELPRQIDLPPVAGWHRVHYAPRVWWEPRARGAEHRLLGSYADAQGRVVDVFFAAYAGQGEGREAGGFGEGALPGGGKWDWLSPGPAFPDARSDRLLAEARTGRLAVTWYRTGDLLTGSNVRLKLANMRDRLLLRARPTTMLIISAEERQGMPATDAVRDFGRAVQPLGPWMDRTAGVR